MDKNGNETSVNTYDSDFSIKEISEQTERHFNDMKKLMNETVDVTKYDKGSVVRNYYKASNTLMEIGTTENLPSELMELCLNASRATVKIIDYINEHKND